MRSDLKYVKCQVCQEVAKVLTREANTLREEKAKGPKHLPLTEHDILEKVEKVCDVETTEGEWLIKHDLQETEDKLEMVFMDGNFGSCGTECKTMQAACQGIVGDRDTDIAEALFAGQMKRAALSNFLCNSKPNGACLKKVGTDG